MTTKQRAFWSVLASVLLLDQLTKIAVRLGLEEARDRITVIPGFFELVHLENDAAAFGMLGDFEGRMVVYALGTLIAFGAVAVLQRRLPAEERTVPAILGLVLAGVLGNAIDRLLFGSVTDFLLVRAGWAPLRDWLIATVGTATWPAFNVADSALVVGVLVYLATLVSPDTTDELSEGAEPR